MKATGNKFSYDGTYEGFLCVAVRCINMRTMPSHIKAYYLLSQAYDAEEYQFVRTDKSLADKFYRYIGSHASVEIQQMTMDCFLTCLPDKEKDIIYLICRALRFGASVAEDFSNDILKRIQNAICDLYREAHSTLDGITFTQVEEVDVSVVNPRNCVIPIVKRAVLRRSESDNLIMYDRRHRLTLLRHGDTDSVVDVSRIPISNDMRSPSMVYQDMWKYLLGTSSFYFTDKAPARADTLSPMWYIAV